MRLKFFNILTDCFDANAAGRQIARVQALYGLTPGIIPVRNDLMAGGCLVDILDATRVTEEEGVILINVAPRATSYGKHPNGVPFCYTRIRNTLVVSTFGAETFSLTKKLGLLTEDLYLLDIPTVMQWAAERHFITPADADWTERTQFRSFEFEPRVPQWVLRDEGLPAEKISKETIPDAERAIWFIDQFGNCKTTLLPGEEIPQRLRHVPLYDQLAKVPKGKPGWVNGSSGFGQHRWREFVVQGRSAATEFDLAVGAF